MGLKVKFHPNWVHLSIFAYFLLRSWILLKNHLPLLIFGILFNMYLLKVNILYYCVFIYFVSFYIWIHTSFFPGFWLKYSIPRLPSTSIIININSYYASNTKQIEFINCIFKISLIYIKKKYCFFFLAPKEKHNLFILFIKFITSLRKF